MASKPNKLPRWATAAGRRVEPPETGTATATKDNGWPAGKRLPVRLMNWLQGLAYDWLSWITDVSTWQYTYDVEGASYNVAFTSAYPTYGNVGTGASLIKVDIPNAAIGDVFLVDFMGLLTISGVNGGNVRILAIDDFGGAAASSPVPGARVEISQAGVYPLCLAGVWTVTTAGTTRFVVQGCVRTSTAAVFGSVVSLRAHRTPKAS